MTRNYETGCMYANIMWHFWILLAQALLFTNYREFLKNGSLIYLGLRDR